ncbi:polyprenyl synthetase family protein [Cypionkella sp.]|uniref:polyprenyl synthetase family protein n=1 Tax=Cypionkella sp. TaxID=2811411 RepID=UPI0027249CC4|nr:farnesyl diphosphate synthase [Cypionkella sp.]MDO8984016.1 polyprenyl synthetase family protein [Cypionkella sp.]MDP2049216.1 polyprenyl synthetase family protein [Cypionkella sp.]
MSFPTLLAADAGLIQARLNAAFAQLSDQPVIHAMAYACTGGKRLRGFLTLESARMLGVSPTTSISAAAAVEALHAYSLIHDDLPAMDNDTLRRGQPTVHIKWDEATAILAGDALQTLAFELLTDPALGPADIRLKLIAGLTKASGAEGMVLGQALDIAAESVPDPLTLDQITQLQAGKTGALIRFAAESGAILAEQNPRPLRAYATALGLAFQIADDILDVTGDAAKAGKRLQKDAAAGKATFVSLLGLDAARARAKSLVSEACDHIAPYGASAQNLIDCACFIIARES